MRTEQIQQIVEGAPDGATHYASCSGEYLDYEVDTAFLYGKWSNVRVSDYAEPHDISDLREILALRQQLEKCERRVIKNCKQRQRWKKRAEQAESKCDELAAHVARLRTCLSMLTKWQNHVDPMERSMAIAALNQTPAPSLEALKLEQQANGVEDFINEVADSVVIPKAAAVRQEYYKAGVRHTIQFSEGFISKLRNQAKEQE